MDPFKSIHAYDTYIWLYKQTGWVGVKVQKLLLLYPAGSRVYLSPLFHSLRRPSVTFERAIPWGALLYGQIIYKYELLIAEVAVTKGPSNVVFSVLRLVCHEKIFSTIYLQLDVCSNFQVLVRTCVLVQMMVILFLDVDFTLLAIISFLK